MYNLIPISIILISLAVIAFIILRKFPFLANFDINSMPKEKEAETKNKIMEQRIQRKTKVVINKFIPLFGNYLDNVKTKSKSIFDKIKQLEEKYKKKQKKENLVTKKEFEQYERTIENIIKEAEEMVEEEKYDEAEKKYIEVIGMEPKNIEAYRGLGNLYILQKNYEDAKQTFAHILKINELDDWAYAKLGKIAQEQGDYEKAKEQINKSINIKSAAIHYFELAEVNQKMNESEQAYENLVKALEIEPNNPKYIDLYINVCIQLKNKELALKALAHFKDINPENQKIQEFESEIKEL